MNLLRAPGEYNSPPEIIVCADVDALYERAAAIFVEESAKAITSRGRFVVALSGGTTPLGLYELLASADWRGRIGWERTHIFFVDEHFVPSKPLETNFWVAWTMLLSRVAVPLAGIHAMQIDLPTADDAAIEYEKTIREVFSPGAPAIPQFDLVLLGLGADGHTASLFPHSSTLRHKSRWVVAGYIEAVKGFRITMTPVLLNHACAIFFLVAGEGKAKTVREVLLGDCSPDRLPAQLISPLSGNLRWLLDNAAAGELVSGAPPT